MHKKPINSKQQIQPFSSGTAAIVLTLQGAELILFTQRVLKVFQRDS